ncbi:MFS transporter [Bordetella trematum]|uniref:MFS transporter n=1 Tax=Bordetella trematum TaxID=123899 RepID=UPI0015585437|nr:MFS transporter [Bordetella trematum]
MSLRQSAEQAAAAPAAAGLPYGALLALATTGFIGILTETLPAGLLPQINQGLGVSQALAGQTITVYAVGSILAAIPLTLATRHWRRRSVLLMAIAGFLVFNTITALSSSYPLTLAARLLAGLAAGLSWTLLPGYARRMVAPAQQGRAMALAMAGTPVALALGVPLGTWLGQAIGWRNTFGLVSGVTLLLWIGVLRAMPDFPAQRTAHRRLRTVLRLPGLRPILLTTALWMLAHNLLYTYVAPFVAQAGLGGQVDRVLLVFGVCALLSLWLAGLAVDRCLRRCVLSSLALFVAAAGLLAGGATQAGTVYLAVILWGLSFGGAATLLQTALADSAGEAADVAQSMSVTIWNSAIAGGGAVGGLLLQSQGLTVFPWVLAALALAALLVAAGARRHGFTPGPRAGKSACARQPAVQPCPR